MKRREFMKKAGLGLAAAAGASAVPSAVRSQETSLPTVKWRLASSVPKSLDTIYDTSETLTKRIADLTEGKFEIRLFAAGEIVFALRCVGRRSTKHGGMRPYVRILLS